MANPLPREQELLNRSLTNLTCFYLRAFRFTTRCLYGRGKLCNQGSSRQSGILMHLGPPRPRDSSALGMVWMRMPASSSERLVT